MSRRPNWTLQERFYLHVFFSHHQLDYEADEDVWYAMFCDIVDDPRKVRTCREDYKYSHGTDRSKMYDRHIKKSYSKYNAEERAAWHKALRDVAASAKRLGFKVTGSAGAEAQEEESEDDDAEEQEFEDDDHEEDVEEDAEEDVEEDVDEDVEMEDAAEGDVTAEEEDDEEDATPHGEEDEEDATAQEEEDGDEPSSEDEADRWDSLKSLERFKSVRDDFYRQADPKVLASSDNISREFALTGTPTSFLISELRARGISIGGFASPTDPESVATPNHEITSGASSSNSIDPADSDDDNPTMSARSSGKPQKRGHVRPNKPKVDIANKTTGADEGPKRAHSRPEKPLASFGDEPSAFSAFVSRMCRDATQLVDESDDQEMEESQDDQEMEELQDDQEMEELQDDHEKEESQDDTLADEDLSGDSNNPSMASQKRKRVQVDSDHGSTKKCKSLAPSAQDKHVQRSGNDHDEVEGQVKRAVQNAELPLAPVKNEPYTVNMLTLPADPFDIWCREHLDWFLFDEPFDIFQSAVVPVRGKRASPKLEFSSSDDRVTNFFFDMFDHRLSKKVILSTLKQTPDSDVPGRRLKKIYKTLMAKAEVISAGPRYNLCDVFTSEASSFSNFRLASSAYGKPLKMLHMSDLDYTFIGNQQLVAFAKFNERHLTADGIDFISPDEPIFKHGGRVHRLWVRQQDCPILGPEKRFNSAQVSMDVMICQHAHCPKCSKSEDGGEQESVNSEFGDDGGKQESVSSLPHVHHRHILDGAFDPPLLRRIQAYEKDDKGEVIRSINADARPIKFWDGTVQDVAVCDALRCLGCKEAYGRKGWVSKAE